MPESRVLRAIGSSTSTTPGTVVAEIVADPGWKITEWYLNCGQTNAASTQLRCEVEYVDGSTETADTVAATSGAYYGNAGGFMRRASGTVDAITTITVADIRAVRIETLGTGSGTRMGMVAGVQVPV